MTGASIRTRLRPFAQPATYIGLATILCLFGTLIYLIGSERRHALEEGMRNGENIAHLFAQAVTRAIRTADNIMILMRRSDIVRQAELIEWSTESGIRDDLPFRYTVTDRNGTILASSYTNALGLNITDRNHFSFHRDHAEDAIRISPPLALKSTGQSTIFLTRRIERPDGEFDGVVAASFEIGEIEKLYRSVSFGRDGVVALVGLDGVIRAAGGDGGSQPDIIGRNIKDSNLFRRIRSEPQGVLWTSWNPDASASADHGGRHLVAFRSLGPLPLIAIVGMSEKSIYYHATDTALAYFGITSLITLAILIGIAGAAARERKLIAATSEITRQAYRDGLTQLANRALFRRQLEDAIARAQTLAARFTLFVLDLDNFKLVNDSLGHTAGDDLIQQMARRLENSVRKGDIVARLGGDEFAIIQFVDGAQRDEAIVLAARLLETIGEPYTIDGHQAIVETSIGIAFAPADGKDAHQLLKNADLALYRAKAEGRNVYRMFDPQMSAEARRRHDLEHDLRTADESEFEACYQMIVEIATGHVCGAEALMRWNHPRRGSIPPDTFIPVAESTGLIVPLGDRILHRACLDAAAWPEHVKVAVNLSPIQFRKGDIVEAVSRALLTSGLAPERLELEITESVLLQGDESKLHSLKALGVSIALDDFGAGYSSLSYLRTFPFDKIKIDRSFVAGLTTRSDCAAIVCAITGLARTLQATTVAEGVETMEQFELLRAAGCHQAQGYLFGRPRRLSDIEFASWRRPALVTTAA